MERCMLLRLPNELLMTLIEYVDSPGHAALAQTCRALNVLTTPYLYKNANIQLGKSNEFVRTMKTKYADLVRHLSVVIEDKRPNISPCRIVPCLAQLENLESLQLVGGYWMWNDKGENWYTLEKLLWEYFERASLKQPTESRLSRSLRSLTLDRVERNGQAAFLEESCIFIIPQLHDLTLRGFMLEEGDAEVDVQFERQTELKSLRIERSSVSFPALRKALLAPRALRYLSICHLDCYRHHEINDGEINHATVAEFVDALLSHRESLEEIKLVVDEDDNDGYSPEVSTINDPSFRTYATQLPALKRWLGCDEFTLKDYLDPRGIYERTG
ncbi:hypothetical protein PMG11_01427 [Penicillium brasilianum]|uniref:F-box domain-containing protein n=1 Tax=Penicillium brasilianum TaxID=104259 RepID=A0A0F7TGZ8_PENBI|nr:hypothetical protein PMG11_01427 [Penicillium brasilianum]